MSARSGTPTGTPDLLTYDQVAQRLGVKRSWLEDQVQARLVPHRRLGRQVRFSHEDLDQIIAMSSVPAVGSTRRRNRAPRRDRPVEAVG